jgi:hypothetical protein
VQAIDPQDLCRQVIPYPRRRERSGIVFISSSVTVAPNPGTAADVEGPTEPDAPWGVFPTAGDDDWCVVIVRGGDDWQAL